MGDHIPMLSRRSFIATLATGTLASIVAGSYAIAIEPRLRLVVTRYAPKPPNWTAGSLRVAALADLHACEPWMPVSRIEEIVAATNALAPDVVVLLGDFVASIRHRLLTGVVTPDEWGRALRGLSAPLGVHAVLGNHDWWTGAAEVRRGLADNGIALLENDVTLLQPSGGQSVWLAGHTHGGQVDLPFIGRPIVPSRYGDRYAYGHVIEDSRHLIVSGGLGCTGLPIRIGVPPEIVLIDIGGSPTA